MKILKQNINLTESIDSRVVLILYSLILVAFSVVFLLTTPKAVGLLESNVFVKENSFAKLPVKLPDVMAVEKKPVQIITDLNIVAPLFSAVAVFAQDYDSGQMLYQKNIHARLAPASTTKVMTALVAADYYKQTDVLAVTPESTVSGSTMGLVVGEKVTFRDMLYGLLLNSGNDAAYAIADNYPGGITAFVSSMNRKAQLLGLADTHFQNPAGFDNLQHYSSAYDLAIISKKAIENPLLATIVSTKATTVTSIDKTKVHHLQNVNSLLGQDGVIGIKTGYTEKAGENLVGLVDRNGYKVLTVVLGSTNRFEETKLLMNWIYNNYIWQTKLY